MVCLDEINKEDLENYKIECEHKFCKECWINYIEEKINSNEEILRNIMHGKKMFKKNK